MPIRIASSISNIFTLVCLLYDSQLYPATEIILLRCVVAAHCRMLQRRGVNGVCAGQLLVQREVFVYVLAVAVVGGVADSGASSGTDFCQHYLRQPAESGPGEVGDIRQVSLAR